MWPQNQPTPDWRQGLSNTRDAIERLMSSILAEAPAVDTIKLRAAIYTRKSRIEPGATHYSLEIQPDRAEAYVTAQGWEVYKIYSDPHRTGRNSRRPNLKTMIADIEAGRVDVVVVHRLDRLYRNLEALLKFIRTIKKYRVRLVSVTEQIDSNTPWGRLVTYVLGALAEMFVWQTSERTRESKVARMRKGLPNGQLPLGYCNGRCAVCSDPNGPGYCFEVGKPDRSDGRRPQPHPIDQYAVRLIHHLYGQGASYVEIADYLNANQFELPNQPDRQPVRFRTRGVPSQSVPRLFGRDSIRGVICNPFYAGLVARYPTAPLDMDDDEDQNTLLPKKPAVKARRQPLELQLGQHEAILSVKVWQRSQQQRTGKGHTPATSINNHRVYALSGVGRCLECLEHDGTIATLRGSSGWKGKQYYRCATVQDRGSRTPVDTTQYSDALAAVELKAQARPDAWTGPEHHVLPADELMTQVDELVGRLVIPEEWYEEIMASYLSEDGMAAFERETYNLRQEMYRLQDMYQTGYLDRAEFQARVLRLDQQMVQLKPSAHPAAAEIIPLLKDFPRLWSLLKPERKRILLGIMFEGLYFDKQGQLNLVQAHSPFDQLLGLVFEKQALAPALMA